ncbi:MAG: autotransporter-associated beta strand repeat-containing protein [Luteolibacter sp.]
MKPRIISSKLRILGISLAALSANFSGVTAATIYKNDNATPLNITTSWSGDIAPGVNDIAAWDNAITSANSTVLGADLAWKGIFISTPAGPVTIGGGNTLTLGRSGIDMSIASQGLTISSNFATAAGNQTWNVATGQTLTLQTGTFTRAAAATVTIDRTANTGTIAASNIANTNNIVGPWMTVTSLGVAANGSPNGNTFATSGATLTPFIAATPAANYGYTSSTTANYDVALSAPQTIGVSRDANTVRHIGGAATVISNGTITCGFNGLMNAGTGLLTLGDTALQLMNIKAGVGTGTELVLHAASSNISILEPIVNNGANASSVTINGPGTVTLGGGIASTYTGSTTINSGTLSTNQNLGAASTAAVVNSGATLAITGGTYTNVVTGGGAVTSTNSTITGNWSNFAGSFTHTNGTASASFSVANATSKFAAYSLTTATASAQGFIAGFNTGSASGTYTLELGSLSGVTGTLFRGGNTALGIATLRIGNLNTDTTYAGAFNDGTTTKIAIDKVGTGILTLSGSNPYTAGTTISAGTLLLTGALSSAANAVTVSGGATLAGTGTIAGNVSVSSSGILENGNGGTNALTAAGLSFAGAATINAHFNVTTPPLAVTGALSTTPASGQVTLNVASTVPLANGTYNLISYGSFGGAASNFTANVTTGLNSRQSASMVLSGNNVALQVFGDTPKWTGAFSNNWTTNAIPGAKNWKLAIGNTATDFISGDNVLFDDSAAGSGAVVVNIGDNSIDAGIIEFNNTRNYTLSSDNFNSILSGSLTKNGTGSLTIENANSYPSGTTFNGGALKLNNNSAIGSGTLTIGTGSPKVLDNTSSAGVSFFSNAAQNWNDDFTFTGTNDLDFGSGAVTVGGSGTDRTITTTAGTLSAGEVKAAAQGLVKQGAGTLVIASGGAGAAGSAISGTLNIAAGTLQINRSGNTGAGSGDFTTTGLTGTGTVTNGAGDERWLTVNTASNNTFTGTLANGGTGGLGFDKQGAGNLTLAGANSYTGLTTVDGGTLILPVANSGTGSNAVVNSGTLVLGNPSALGTPATPKTIRLAGNAISTLELAHDGGGPVYGFIFGTTTNATIIANRATAGAGINHTLTTVGSAGVGGGTITFTSGANVTTGSGRITFTEFGLAAGTVQTTVLNPTTANVTTGNISKVGSTALNQTLELGGTSADNNVTGVIANGDGAAIIAVTKSNSSTWTLSNTNTYTGNTIIGNANGAGVLRATASGALGAGTVLFDGSGGTPGPTSRLELTNNITLANSITLNQRNNTSAAILSVSGNNILGGAIDLNTGGSAANIQSDSGLLTLTGNIGTTTTVVRALHLGGAGNGLASGVIFNGTSTGTVTVTKDGSGTWTLSGANTYTGSTTVAAGTLSIAQPALADAATVSVATDALLNLTHSATDTVDRFFIGGVEQAAGTWGSLTSSAAHKTARITGTGILLATNGAASGYNTWASSFGLDPLTDGAAGFDKDLDGYNNVTEYVLGGSPISGSNNPKIYSLIADSSADGDALNEQIMTIAVPVGTPVFSAGAPASTATFETFGIAIRGSTDLASFPVTVTPVNPIITGLPSTPFVSGGISYEYRSFSLGGSNNLSGKGFLQVTVSRP